MRSRRAAERIALGGVLAAALFLRVRYLSAGVPYAVGIDEPAIVDRALLILRTGSWHPRGFDYPSLVVYLHTCVSAARFLWGASRGEWSSLAGYEIAAVYGAGRLVTALVGTATVWLVWRLGRDLHSRILGLVAAAELAVYPMSVRESHFILTDVPTAALVLVALLLAVRAGRVRTIGAYALAGCGAGLAAAAKYNGIVAAVGIAVVWILEDRRSADRGWKALAAIVAIPATFLVVVPYAFLDMPGFLNGVAAQLARFAPTGPAGGAPPWRAYLIHLSLASALWLPLAAAGAAAVVWRRERLRAWAIPAAFVIAYFYVLASHRVVFGRYALPLVPVLCLFAAVPIVEAGRWVGERRGWRAGWVAGAVVFTAVMTPLVQGSLEWLESYRRPDTRVLAGRWMDAALPDGTRLVVENSGPTNLAAAGVEVVDRPNRLENSPDAYLKQGVSVVVMAPYSKGALGQYGALLAAGRIVFEADPAADRWGPYIRVVQLDPPK
ncbi:MAG TPA: glycosyltransferase family 39 protein [Vicinamibacterales bacterium]|jgi:4-amino-4-deoxy-L-arabinose transferase-like glycosyltransferase|nr:glycosyltransferase family 39 protein [Vicinamibacterales bacterium]